MKYNKKCIAISVILFMLFINVIFGIPTLIPEWFVFHYYGTIHIILLVIFLLVAKYFYNQKCLTASLVIFVSLFILTIIILTIQGEHELKKQSFFYEFDQAAENPSFENTIGLSVARLSLEEKEEIKSVIKKVFEGQWNYYYDKDEGKLDESISGFYLSGEYLLFKEEIKEKLKNNQDQYGYINFTKKDVPNFIKDIKFSKPRKYKDFNNRIGVIAGFSGNNSFSIQYFLLKRENNQWKIEKERITYTSPYELPNTEMLIIEKLMEQKNSAVLK